MVSKSYSEVCLYERLLTCGYAGEDTQVWGGWAMVCSVVVAAMSAPREMDQLAGNR